MKIDHVFLHPRDLSGMKNFLMFVLDFVECDRPNFAFPGVWLGQNNQAWIHLAQGDKENSDTGVIGHVAFRVDSLEHLISRLEKRNTTYRKAIVPGRNEQQIFFKGPEGLLLEVKSKIV